jgi:2-keto-4-pentenoate hydratase/2-oxohepta-3-ene-1,7-dioic acid hydratase in catechol pathway
MRLATIQTPAGPRAVLVRGNVGIELPGGSLRTLLADGLEWLQDEEKLASRPNAVRHQLSDARFLPPITDPQKIICVGLNYRDHAAESGAPIPKEPVLFSKFTTALIGHEEAIVLPRVSEEVDYEAELVLVIGRKGRNLTGADAERAIAGYTIGHDVSARDWQLKKDGKQWLAGKTFDTFAPTGPWMVTADELPDPHKLGIRLRLNGRTMQDSTTAQMIFRAADVVAYVSQVVTLMPGDLVFTGTPPGVGAARKPPVFLKPGDVVEVEIDNIGTLRNPVVAAS